MSPKPAWKNPGISLGARCVIFAKHEMERGVKANPYGQPNTSDEVRKYLAPCLRNLDDDPELENLGLTVGNWCAAFASYCMQECLLPGDKAPHHYRAGVVEIVADARELGLYHEASEVRDGSWMPHPGDLVIWDRSDPLRPETAWHRHVNRLVRLTDNGEEKRLLTIGGNERRTIRLDEYAPKGLDASKLLGFVSYYQKPKPTEVSECTRTQDLALIASFIQAQLQERKLEMPS